MKYQQEDKHKSTKGLLPYFMDVQLKETNINIKIHGERLPNT
jgi:hypothetical protein